MAGSLRDQLLQTGLVSKEQVNKAQHDKRRKRKQAKGQGKPQSNELDLAQAYAERAREEKRERDRELNRKREEERLAKERKAKLRQLLDGKRLNKDGAEVVRNFQHNGRIRRVYVTDEQQQRITDGKLAIAWVDNRYHVVEAQLAKRLAEVDERALALLIDPSEPEDPDYDDPRFKVPDDLTW
jgi:hypothetical protein